jgi:hypothetical protein
LNTAAAKDVYTWNQSMDVKGNALSVLRLTSTTIPPATGLSPLLPKEGPGEVRTWTVDSLTNTFDSSGNVLHAAGTSWQSTPGGISTTGTDSTFSYDASGRVLRETTATTKDGITNVTSDVADRSYDAAGNLIRTTQDQTDGSTGKVTNVTWQGALGSDGLLATDSQGNPLTLWQESTVDGVTTRDTTLSPPEYDAYGRETETDVSEEKRDASGNLIGEPKDTLSKTSYDENGWVSSVGSATFTQLVDDSSGSKIYVGTQNTTEVTNYTRDLTGRVVDTKVNGTDDILIGGQDTTVGFSNEDKITKFDPTTGRTLREYTMSRRDGTPTQETWSLEDEKYDGSGNKLETLNAVRQSGSLSNGKAARLAGGGTALDMDTTSIVKTVATSFDAQGNKLAWNTWTDGKESVNTGGSYNLLGQLTDLTTANYNVDGSSAGGEVQTGLKYDALGNLADWVKTDTAAGGEVTTHTSILAEYDASGRATTMLENVTGPDGVTTPSGNIATRFNDLGEAVGGYENVTVNGTLTADQAKALVSGVTGGALSASGNAGGWLAKSVGVETISGQKLISAQYDSSGRQIDANAESESAGWDATEGFQSNHTPVDTATLLFDAQNRPVLENVTTVNGSTTDFTQQTMRYDANNHVAWVGMSTHETGITQTGAAYDKSYSQTQTFTIDPATGRISSESFTTYGDPSNPSLVTTVTHDGIQYDASGHRTNWTETTVSNANADLDKKVVWGATYDCLNRLETYNQEVWQAGLSYMDMNATNSYDSLGRLSSMTSDRGWGTNEASMAAAAPLMGSSSGTSDSGDSGGGGISGLSTDWTSGRAAVMTTYSYYGTGNLQSGMTVTAHGAGTNADAAIQSQGINLSFTESNMQYNAQGQLTGYHESVSQVQRYTVYSEHMHGLKKKVSATQVVGMDTVDSDVSGIQTDDFGRQIHSVVNSYDHGAKAMVSQDTRVIDFDANGRVLHQQVTTVSHINIPAKRGSFMQRFAVGLTLGILPALLLAVGKGNLLGGKTIVSNTTVLQTMAYKADGSLDEAKTNAQTQTLSSSSHMKGKDWGDKVLMADDITIAVAAVVVTVVSLGTQSYWTLPLIAACSAAYKTTREGISLHDLGVAHENHDRGAEGRRNVSVFWTGVATTAVACVGAWLSSMQAGAEAAANTAGAMETAGATAQEVGAASQAGQAAASTMQVGNLAATGLNGVYLTGYALANAAVQMGVAAACGGNGKTVGEVGALAFMNGAMGGAGGPGLMSEISNLITTVGSVAAPAKQQTTWSVMASMATGGPVSAGSTLLTHEYIKRNDASGSGDESKIENRELLNDQLTQFASTLGTSFANGVVGSNEYGKENGQVVSEVSSSGGGFWANLGGYGAGMVSNLTFGFWNPGTTGGKPAALAGADAAVPAGEDATASGDQETTEPTIGQRLLNGFKAMGEALSGGYEAAVGTKAVASAATAGLENLYGAVTGKTSDLRQSIQTDNNFIAVATNGNPADQAALKAQIGTMSYSDLKGLESQRETYHEAVFTQSLKDSAYGTLSPALNLQSSEISRFTTTPDATPSPDGVIEEVPTPTQAPSVPTAVPDVGMENTRTAPAVPAITPAGNALKEMRQVPGGVIFQDMMKDGGPSIKDFIPKGLWLPSRTEVPLGKGQRPTPVGALRGQAPSSFEEQFNIAQANRDTAGMAEAAVDGLKSPVQLTMVSARKVFAAADVSPTYANDFGVMDVSFGPSAGATEKLNAAFDGKTTAELKEILGAKAQSKADLAGFARENKNGSAIPDDQLKFMTEWQ